MKGAGTPKWSRLCGYQIRQRRDFIASSHTAGAAPMRAGKKRWRVETKMTVETGSSRRSKREMKRRQNHIMALHNNHLVQRPTPRSFCDTTAVSTGVSNSHQLVKQPVFLHENGV